MRTSTRRRGGRLAAALSGGALTAAVGALLFMAVDAQGVPVQHAALNNGGIWVTSDSAGLFGRLNKPAGALDAAFAPAGAGQQSYQLDILQDESAVVAWDQAAGKLYPVDSAHATTLSDQAVPVSGAQQVGFAGGTVAVLDSLTGEVRAQRFDPASGLTSLAALQSGSPAVANLGASASPTDEALTVGQDGTIYAVSTAGKVAIVAPLGTGGFASVQYSRIGHALTDPRITAVGEQAVILDAANGRLYAIGGPSVTVPGVDVHTQLQQAGGAEGSVVLSTSHDLISVDLATGAVSTLSRIGSGAPAAPVQLGTCVYAAWAQTPDGYARSCNGAAAVRGGLSRLQELAAPRFRVNWNQIVLNDLATGGLWDLSDAREVDDWSAVQPPASAKNSSNSQSNLDQQQAANLPPKAQDITLGARPGRTTVLHVLDVDSDPSGAILAVQSVGTPDNSGARLQIAPDAQSVEITLPAGIQAGSIHFQYTVDDSKGLTATATVTVEVRTSGQNALPALRTGFTGRTWTVPAGGSLKIPVLQDWRDYDGDPLALVEATASAGSAAATSDGFVEYTAPASGGGQSVHYQVSDGIGAPVTGTLSIQVQSPTDTAGIAPVAEPDIARGEVGQPIVIHPLANDLPGADPQNPGAALEIAAAVASPSGTTVTTNQAEGAVTVIAQRPGTYLLSYTDQFGSAPFATGAIRVDVTADPSSPQPPVTLPSIAVLHGQQPATVDVLAADFDPSGALLEVQQAAPVNANSGLQVGIVDGRWLRISALSPAASAVPQLVDYTVTDGITAPVTGQVSVTQLAAPAVDTPLTVPTYATVRAGDTVTSDVLVKDIDLAGAPLSLAPDVPGSPGAGQLEVLSPSGTAGAANGSAFVTGDLVTYSAPRTVASPVVETVEYLARNNLGGQAVGYLYVTVDPAPTAMDPNRSPAPPPIQERTVAGDTVTIPISTSGVDPDGDSVTLTGLGSAPSLGRILSQNATSLTYQAFPTSSGTDTFTYQVADRFGATGQSTISIAVVPPATPEPPIAVDEDVTASPGAQVSVNVLADAVAAPDDAVSVTSLATLNKPLPTGTSLSSPTSPILVTAPAANGKPLVVAYGITDGVNPVSVATITVHGQSGYLNPPVAVPTYANPQPKQTTITVDVLGHVTDPDGSASGLTVTQVFDAAAKISGSKVVLPVTAAPQTVAYQVRDAAGATTIGMIYVSAPGYGAPYVKPGALVTVPAGGSTTVKLSDYIVDPADKAVQLTTADKIWAGPVSGLRAVPDGIHALTLTALDGYTGPASLTVQVTDGASLTDPHGLYSVVSIPVQVGPETPVLRCPADTIRVVEGGPSVSLNVAALCHVWTAQPGGAAALRYTAQWQGAAPGLSVSGSGTGTPVVSADSSATAQSSGTLLIGVAGSPAKTSRLAVQAVAAAAPTLAPIAVNGVQAGQTATIDVAPYITSQLRQPVDSVVSVTQSSGMAASVSSSGSVVHITPGSTSHGTMTFTIVVSDVAQSSRTDQRGSGQITLNVLGPPAAPGTPVVGGTVLSGAALLSWAAPADNGAPIQSYQVDYSGGSQTCPASPCTITGLTNGTTYTFTVKAQNVVGWSPASARSGPATPNTVPGAVSGLAVSDPQNGTLKLNWNAAPDQGTPVLDYAVTWTGGGSATVSGTSFTATGLVNDTVYTFTVIPVNRQGPGPSATVSGQSAGAPAQPAAPSFSATELAGSNSRAVTISWTAVDPNGPGPTTYTVTRTGGGTDTVCSNVTATNCLDAGIANDGTVYTYTVTAMNADASLNPSAHTSPPSPGTQMEATATPDPIANLSATPTGVDGQATVKFDAPASHGASSTVTCTYSGGTCGTWTFPTAGQSGVSETVNGLPNGTSETLSLQDCNGSTGGQYAGSPCDSTDSTSVTTYGPLNGLSIQTSASGQTVNFTVSVNPNGKSATVQINTSRQSQTFTTGTGAWSWNGSDTMGYSATDTINVTVSDPGRSSISGSASQSTPAAPPPPATVTVSQGTKCGGGGGSACQGGSCTNSSCAYIHVQTANFSGNVTCSFNSSVGAQGFINETYGPNQSKDSYNWFGYPGDTVTVTCGGVSGSYVWP
ncbi:cadherin-like domain-containing protein [Actinospica sp. MGRD01-02]|uniref:Cadherin-like domain-containing protein n=1 Tax=Actinospica acidithermotolerans TaxID=2828514 RepID=A0A941EDP1_9ACTN|nr:fibronectin type III domain-containing protein [Actinospica acidithermotolerans]MBR7828543.1 cadherin-like domain-containing protein [Actinospica acidithermotolerans]